MYDVILNKTKTCHTKCICSWPMCTAQFGYLVATYISYCYQTERYLSTHRAFAM